MRYYAEEIDRLTKAMKALPWWAWYRRHKLNEEIVALIPLALHRTVK